MMAVLATDVSVPERSAEDTQPSHSETTYFGMIEDPDYSDDNEEQSGHMHIAGLCAPIRFVSGLVLVRSQEVGIVYAASPPNTLA